MKNFVFTIITFALAGILGACSSDDNGNNKGDSNKTKTAFVSVSIRNNAAGNHELTAGDVLYVYNGNVGSNGVVSVLKYTDSGKFEGNLIYSATDDALNAYIKFANTPNVAVDTAARTIKVDYANQNGKESDAAARDYGVSTAYTAKDFLNGSSASLQFRSVSAMLRISKPTNVNAKGYRLTSYGNNLQTKAAAIENIMYFMPATSTSMKNNSTVDTKEGKIVCTTTAETGDYIAFFAQDVADPTLEVEYTTADGAYVIENIALQGETSQEDSYGTTNTTFKAGNYYNIKPTGSVSIGDFLCDASFQVKAIVYDIDNVDLGNYHTARAMSVNECGAGETMAWSSSNVLPSSMAKYITSNVMTDTHGYELTEQYYGNAYYKALNAAVESATKLPGCSNWYLPAAGEWQNLWTNIGGKSQINKKLRQAGATEMNGIKYWTATLRSLTEPCAVMEDNGTLSTIPQPLQSKLAVRASVVF